MHNKSLLLLPLLLHSAELSLFWISVVILFPMKHNKKP